MIKEKNQKQKNSRPPVVVVLGHVDHGKTTLLDTIRKSNVAEKESGGITQHIGAYQVVYTPQTNADKTQINAEKISENPRGNPRQSVSAEGRKITFIDTPGHEAFSAMRFRGASVADIAILVVAADEGLKPQTKEAVEIIKNAKIPFIVAINKIDKPGADANKVKSGLSEIEVFVESWGGQVPSVEISAKQNKGIDELLEMILLVAEMEDFKLDLNKPAKGVVIESYMDSRRGPTATILVKEGVVKLGDFIVCGNAIGKIKAMENFALKIIEEASPSVPIVVTGLKEIPQLGDVCEVVADASEAENKALNYKKQSMAMENVVLGEIMPDTKVFSAILKVDFFGSAEAIVEALKKINLKGNNIAIKFLKIGIGDIDETDIKFAVSGKYVVLGFRVKFPEKLAFIANQSNISVNVNNIIYELVEDVRKKLSDLLVIEIVKHFSGKLKLLAIFKSDANKSIIGGEVLDGKLKKGLSFDVARDGQIAGSGVIDNLEFNKAVVEEIGAGKQCGLLVKTSFKFKEGDVLDIYEKEVIKKEI